MQDFRNLAVWRASRAVVKQVYQTSKLLPRDEDFGLRSQIRRASVSICTNIAEGCGRRGDREFRRYLDHAMGSACELECELILCVDLEILSEAAQAKLLEPLIEIKRMLSGLANRLTVDKPRRRPRAEAES